MTNSLARQTLESARVLASQAAAAVPGELAFRVNLEAALVFGRTVTFHLQKEFNGLAGFDDWYSVWQTAMRADPTCTFFVEKRNFVLKEGRVTFNYTLSVDSAVIGLSAAHVELRVRRGQPWYRRSPVILWNDLTYPLRVWRDRRKAERDVPARAVARQASRRAGAPVIGFADYRPSEPALGVLEAYFDFLERVVTDSEARFGQRS